jgi:hypothetical protein
MYSPHLGDDGEREFGVTGPHLKVAVQVEI